MAHEAVGRIFHRLKAHIPVAGRPIEAVRADFSAFYLSFEPTLTAALQPVTAGAVPAAWIGTPPRSGPVILFFHGGGFSVGSSHDHLGLCDRLSRAAGMPVLSVDYRLAPEHPFPAAIEDCVQTYGWLLSQGFVPSDIVPAGISAGGTLALSLLLALKKNGTPLPRAVCCMSPAVDLAFPGKSVKTNQEKDWITPARLDMIREQYLAGQDPADPLASPIHGNLSGLPPMLLQVGSHELLLDDVSRFAEKARQAGVQVTLEVWEEMIHTWQIFASAIPEGRQAIDLAGRFIRASLTSR